MPGTSIEADRDRILQVMSNLIVNAQHNPTGADIDEAEDTNVRVTWLNFVLRCRALHQESGDAKRVSATLAEMHADFFAKSRVALSNRANWDQCQKLCAARRGDLTPLWRAHDDVMRKLDDLHQPFLLTQRGTNRNSLPDVIQQCLL